RTALLGYTPEELTTFVEGLGQPRFRANQLFGWLQRQGAQTFREMTNLPKALIEQLEAVALAGVATEVTRQEAQETGTTKLLLAFAAGGQVESVLMRHGYGNAVCVTTQVGCRMGCAFCASTLGGLERNLTAAEIVGQVTLASRLLPPGERVSS